MKIYIINSGWGSGGPDTVAAELYYVAKAAGNDVRFASARGNVPNDVNHYQIGKMSDVYLHVFFARIFDNMGLMSVNATRNLVCDIEQFKPDVISIHDPLGYTMNYVELFKFIRESGIRTFWTLHDCWAITGHCITGLCDKVFDGCYDCPRKKEYPTSLLLDKSKRNYRLKKQTFSGINNLSIITPSNWLSRIVGKSFLDGYKREVIHNGIDLEVFKPLKSDIKNKYKLDDKIIVLAVAGIWNETKGKDHFYSIADRLGTKYQCVMIGKNDDPKKDNIIYIDRTENREKLCEWYSVADVFVNPTLADNFPTVNIESLACGTPVVTFDTGGSGESVGKCGAVIEQGNDEKLVEAIEVVINQKISVDDCVNQAKLFDKWERYNDYLQTFGS